MLKLNKNFKNFKYGLGGIPLTYLQSLSYEEQLLWFCKNLQDVINRLNEISPSPSPTPTPTPSEEKFYKLTATFTGVGSNDNKVVINNVLPEGLTNADNLYCVGGKLTLTYALSGGDEPTYETVTYDYSVNKNIVGDVEPMINYDSTGISFYIFFPTGSAYTEYANVDGEVSLIFKEFKEGENDE